MVPDAVAVLGSPWVLLADPEAQGDQTAIGRDRLGRGCTPLHRLDEAVAIAVAAVRLRGRGHDRDLRADRHLNFGSIDLGEFDCRAQRTFHKGHRRCTKYSNQGKGAENCKENVTRFGVAFYFLGGGYGGVSVSDG